MEVLVVAAITEQMTVRAGTAADEESRFDPPVPGLAGIGVPARQILAVEERDEAVRVGRGSDRAHDQGGVAAPGCLQENVDNERQHQHPGDRRRYPFPSLYADLGF